MFTIKDLKRIDPLAAVAAKPEIYFGDKDVRGWMLASRLVEDALVLGVSPVTVTMQLEDWTTVAGPVDWTVLGPGGDLPTTDLFRCMIPFEEAGINACRHEILVAAFAKALFRSQRRRSAKDQGRSGRCYGADSCDEVAVFHQLPVGLTRWELNRRCSLAVFFWEISHTRGTGAEARKVVSGVKRPSSGVQAPSPLAFRWRDPDARFYAPS